MSNEAKAVACRVAKSDWEAEEIVAAVDSELAPLLARVERLEQAFGQMIMMVLQNDFEGARELATNIKVEFPNGGPRAALNDEEVTQPDFQGNDYFHACDFDHGPVCIICGEPSKEANDG